MTKTAVLDKINSLNQGSGYSNNRMAYELSKIIRERTIDKNTLQQQASARKEFSEIFSSKINTQKSKEELADKFRDRFLKQMGVSVATPSKSKEVNDTPVVIEPKEKNKKPELPKIEEIRRAIPQMIKTIIFKGKGKDTNNKSFETKAYKANLSLDGSNQQLTVERKSDKSVVLEALKRGKEEFEIKNSSINKNELEEIQHSLKLQPTSNKNNTIKNKSNDLEM